MKRRILGLCIAVLMLAVFQPQVSASTQEYSASTKESTQREGERTGRIFVGKDGVRTEYEANGERYAQIINYTTDEVYLVNTDKRTFMRRPLGQAGAQAAREPSANPCEGNPGLDCKSLGMEKVHGRDAVKWSLSQKDSDTAGEMTLWLDRQRHIPLRQVMPDGATMSMQMLGMDTVNQRKTEKWEITYTGPDGDKRVSYQWYDPVLATNIRDEQPDMYTRDLFEVRPGPQPATLFVVPRDYTEIKTGQGGQYQR